ncbi:MAG: ribosome silencing factor [Flammeovirgaceae bacterium]
MVKETEVVISSALAMAAVEGMQEKKAVDIRLMDLREIKNSIADYFVICSGNSDTQVEAIKDSVDEFIFKKFGENPWKVEGTQNKEWILMDYVNVVVHIFQKKKREFYGLEELWGDAIIKEFE